MSLNNIDYGPGYKGKIRAASGWRNVADACESRKQAAEAPKRGPGRPPKDKPETIETPAEA